MFVTEALMDEAGIVLAEAEIDPAADGDGEAEANVDPDEEVQAFREFLDSVSPDDFGPVEAMDRAIADYARLFDDPGARAALKP